MNKSILIIGAGAIGRGFIAPLFKSRNYKISFMDNNISLINKLKKKKYIAAFARNNSYTFSNIDIENIYHTSDSFEINYYDFIFICVGPRNYLSLAEILKKYKNICYTLENDDKSAINLRKITGNKNIFFGIPDVISSNTAPDYLLKKDSLTTVSEVGNLVLENSSFKFPKQILVPSGNKFREHWICKLFIHNAPHAVAAYLGSIYGYTYIHQAMKDKYIFKIVNGSITEITNAIIKSKYSSKKFANYYMNKELKRFMNPKLFDPISRVARDPIRKLSPDNRLILSMRMLMGLNLPYKNTAKGVKSVFFYKNNLDEKSLYLQKILATNGIDKCIEEICGINSFDPLSKVIKNSKIKKYDF